MRNDLGLFTLVSRWDYCGDHVSYWEEVVSYTGIVTKISVRPHPNADRLQIGTCCNSQVIVGLDTKEDDIGVYFAEDGQLSHEFTLANGLYSKSALEKLDIPFQPEQTFGFFSEKRRVRSQSFRGVKSEGFWVPLSYFTFLNTKGLELKEGYTFSELVGVPICQKYITKATRDASGKVGRKQRENKCFPKHDVSKKFKFVNRLIPDGAVCWITEKLHGTSGRYGYVLDETPLPGWKRFANRILPLFHEREYRYLNGSKNVILEKTTGAGWYGTNEFRYGAVEGITLHKGEILYFEIVGFYKTQGDKDGHFHYRPIMDPQPILDLKDLKKTYGELMTYSYGLKYGEADIYVYKIVRINEDGNAIDLGWNAVKARCKELGLKHVPELAGPFIHKLDRDDPTDTLVEALTLGPSTLDATHIREGVVLRTEAPEGVDYVKNKSWEFGVLEGYIKDSDTYVDTEEAS